MTWTYLLTVAAEACLAVLVAVALIRFVIYSYYALRMVWHRARVRQEMDRIEKRHLEAMARYRQDLHL